MLPLLTALSPNAAILILTLGIALIALELNRPGSIIPGALGLILSLLSAASLLAHRPSADAAVELLLSVALLVVAAWRNWNRGLRSCLVILATPALIHAIATLLPAIPGPKISGWAAILSGLILGAGTTVLTRIARRARLNKGLD